MTKKGVRIASSLEDLLNPSNEELKTDNPQIILESNKKKSEEKIQSDTMNPSNSESEVDLNTLDSYSSSLDNMEPLDPDMPYPLSVIKITALALEKMFILAESVLDCYNTPYEIYALCLGKNQIIQDILIPRQNVAFASVRVNPEFIHELRTQIITGELEVLGWTHSHANFPVFFSFTDNFNQLTVLNDTSNFAFLDEIQIKYVYGMTVNLLRETFGIATTQYPTGDLRHISAEIQIIDTLPVNWDYKTNKSKIIAEVQKKIILPSPPSAIEETDNHIESPNSNNSITRSENLAFTDSQESSSDMKASTSIYSKVTPKSSSDQEDSDNN